MLSYYSPNKIKTNKLRSYLKFLNYVLGMKMRSKKGFPSVFANKFVSFQLAFVDQRLPMSANRKTN